MAEIDGAEMEENVMIRFATIGTSKITTNFLEAAVHAAEFKLEAVYSRDKEHAEAFGKQYGAERFYDSLEALAADPAIDAVYIASPNFLHSSQANMLMKAGKHVLCEKSIASNTAQAEEMFRTAEENHVVLLEAMRSVFVPGMEIIKSNLSKLGTIRKATINFCQYSSRYDSFLQGQDHNIFRRECSAGALMDIGVYCVHALLHLFGVPEQVVGYSDMLRGEIDGAGSILTKYTDMIAEVQYSKITNSRVPSEIQGEKGVMLIPMINRPGEVKIIYQNGEQELLSKELPEYDMRYELEYFIRAIQGKEEVQSHTDRSLAAMKLMDTVRSQCGIVFPADGRETQKNDVMQV